MNIGAISFFNGQIGAIALVPTGATQYSVSSGEISLGGVQTFFADSGSLALSDLYRGGGIVPDITENSSVPASGEITLSDMYGVYKNT